MCDIYKIIHGGDVNLKVNDGVKTSGPTTQCKNQSRNRTFLPLPVGSLTTFPDLPFQR